MQGWIEFVVAAAAILAVSDKLSANAEKLAERTGVGRGFIGVVLLGAVTSLPELITSISSIEVVGNVDMAVGNVFGSNLFNVLIIAILDFVYRERSFDSGNVLTATLSTLVALVAIAGLVFGDMVGGLFHLSWFSVAIVVLYVMSLRALYAHDKGMKVDATAAPPGEQADETPMSSIVLGTAVAALGVVVAGVVASHGVGLLADQYHLGGSFAGGLFLAFATSLPELVVSFAAVRRGATVMAAGNVFGSNLFNLAILPVADLLVDKPLFAAGVLKAKPHLLLAVGGLVLTSLAVSGILLGKRRLAIGRGRIGFESLAIAGCYLVVMWANYAVA